MKTNLLLDMTIDKFNLESANKMYIHYDPRKKNKFKPRVISEKQKENIRKQILNIYKSKPKDFNHIRIDVNASKSSDLDNKLKTVLDSCETIILKNDRTITSIIIKRNSFNKIHLKNKNTRIDIPLINSSLDNSINKHWMSKKVRLSKKASAQKKGFAQVAMFYRKNKKKVSTNRIIVKIDAVLRSVQDLDNILKPILDSLSGVIYKDDKQIDWLFATKTIDNKSRNTVSIKVWERIS